MKLTINRAKIIAACLTAPTEWVTRRQLSIITGLDLHNQFPIHGMLSTGLLEASAKRKGKGKYPQSISYRLTTKAKTLVLD